MAEAPVIRVGQAELGTYFFLVVIQFLFQKAKEVPSSPPGLRKPREVDGVLPELPSCRDRCLQGSESPVPEVFKHTTLC